MNVVVTLCECCVYVLDVKSTEETSVCQSWSICTFKKVLVNVLLAAYL